MAKSTVDRVSLADIVNKVAAETGNKKTEVREIAKAIFGAIEAGVRSGSKVSIPGFGAFVVRHMKARNGRNPQTGATIKIKASRKLVWRAAKAFKDSV